MPESVYVRGDSKSIFEGMTREQILAAITQAVEGGTVSDIDTGFVTKLKEINKGLQLRFWVGTTAEYNALVEAELTESNVLYIKTDDTSPQNISDALTALSQTVQQMQAQIAELQAGKYIPVNGVIAFDTANTPATAAEVAALMGYGTWVDMGVVNGEDYDFEMWRRFA